MNSNLIQNVFQQIMRLNKHFYFQIATLSQIQLHLSQQKYEDAFETALSAEDLSCVIYVCEKVDLNRLFGKICILQQNCLLALIQQLGNELHRNTELKLRYVL